MNKTRTGTSIHLDSAQPENNRSIAYRSIQLMRHCWIGLLFAVVLGLAMIAPPAWAGPSAQFTVPTATPTADQPPPADPNLTENNDVSELFDPTATPEPNNESSSSNSDNDSSNNDSFDNSQNDPFAEEDNLFETDPLDEFLPDVGFDDNGNNEIDPLAPENFLDDGTDGLEGGSLGNDTFLPDPDPLPAEADNEFDGVIDTGLLNMYNAPDLSAGIIDTLFRNTPIQVLDQDSTGQWVQVCCGEERGSTGWVDASQVTLSASFDANTPDLPLTDTQESTAGDASSDTDSNSLELGQTELDQTELDLQLNVTSPAVMPGQTLEVEFWVTNVGTNSALDVSLRNELPEDIEFLDALFSEEGKLFETTNAYNDDAPVFRIDWPELAPGERATATVSIQIGEDIGYGVVIDNLAGVGASNAEIETAGASIGTPPISPPDFRILR
ncbi:MAG: SH3 domain-containing protein [Chloroflexota bacterium]